MKKLILTGLLVSIFGCTQKPPLQADASIKPNPDNMIVCTMDAKICPDGTGVGRTGPKCEFAPCPSTPTK